MGDGIYGRREVIGWRFHIGGIVCSWIWRDGGCDGFCFELSFFWLRFGLGDRHAVGYSSDVGRAVGGAESGVACFESGRTGAFS